MPETFPTNLWTRQQWQQARADKAKNGVVVPKGAAKVSIGDGIEKFHAANAKGVSQGVKAAEKLKKDLAVYLAAVKTKYPKWYTRVQKQVEYNVDMYLKDTKRLPHYVTSYGARYRKVHVELAHAGSQFVQWEKDGSQGTFKPSNAKVLVTALTDLNEAVKKMPYHTDKITKAQAKTFDQTVYNASSDTAASFNKPTMDGLLSQFAKLPATV